MISNIDSLEQGREDANIRNDAKEKRYAKMELKTVPPLVVERGKIVDGNHRYRVMKKLGVSEWYIYDIVDIE